MADSDIPDRSASGFLSRISGIWGRAGFTRSLRWRIHFWHSFMLTGVVLLFGGIIYYMQHRSVLRSIDDELGAAVEVLCGQLRASSSVLHDRDPATKGDVDLQAMLVELELPETFAPRRYHRQSEHPYFLILDGEGIHLKSQNLQSLPASVGAGAQRVEPILERSQSDRVFHTIDASNLGRGRFQGPFRECHGRGGGGLVVIVGREIRHELESLNELIGLLSVGAVLVIGIGLVGGWFLAGKSIQSIDVMSRVASEISEENLGRRIEVSDTDAELAELANTLNQTFQRLENAFQRQSQFTADASHELRTPLSVLQMHQDLALSAPRSEQEYRQSMEICSRATHRMKGLIDSLLTLARLDSQAEDQRELINVSDLVTQCAESVLPLAAEKQIQLEIQTDTEAIAAADSHQLGQVFSNLIVNAINYSEGESMVSVTCQNDQGKVVVEVIDQGFGIPQEDLPHIFERFYRVDKQRSRVSGGSGGSGLGLAIAEKIVHHHGGSITVTSVEGSGSTFRVELPKPK